jgi:hypothetical protein
MNAALAINKPKEKFSALNYTRFGLFHELRAFSPTIELKN